MTIGERIAARRKQLNMTQEELARKMGYKSRASINKIELEWANVPLSKLEKVAAALDCEPAYLMGWQDEKGNAVGFDYSSPPSGFQPMPVMDIIPLVGDIACGSPILAEGNIRDHISAPSSWRADFSLECHGDSMAPKILDGDIVAVRKVAVVNNGQIAAVRIDDEATLKRTYMHSDKLVLQAENPAYEPIVLIGEDMERAAIEGLVVGLMRNI